MTTLHLNASIFQRGLTVRERWYLPVEFTPLWINDFILNELLHDENFDGAADSCSRSLNLISEETVQYSFWQKWAITNKWICVFGKRECFIRHQKAELFYLCCKLNCFSRACPQLNSSLAFSPEFLTQLLMRCVWLCWCTLHDPNNTRTKPQRHGGLAGEEFIIFCTGFEGRSCFIVTINLMIGIEKVCLFHWKRGHWSERMSFEIYCTKDATLLYMYLSLCSCSLVVVVLSLVEGVVL